MNIGELTATLGIDTAPLRSATQAAERAFRELERTVQSVSARINTAFSRIAPIDTRGLRSAERGVRDFSKTAVDGFDKATSSAEGFNNDLLKFGRTLASFAAVFYTVKNALGVFRVGIEFDKTMEENRLAMAALIGSMYDYQDASGNVVDSSRAFDAAMDDSIALQKELRIAALATSATYQELALGMQVAFAPAKEAGIKIEQLTSFVQRFAQVMQVMTVPMNQMSEEVRSFLTGVMVPRQTRLESYCSNREPSSRSSSAWPSSHRMSGRPTAR